LGEGGVLVVTIVAVAVIIERGFTRREDTADEGAGTWAGDIHKASRLQEGDEVRRGGRTTVA
jgi:hypothetical protein